MLTTWLTADSAMALLIGRCNTAYYLGRAVQFRADRSNSAPQPGDGDGIPNWQHFL
jgi:hypothetical protein